MALFKTKEERAARKEAKFEKDMAKAQKALEAEQKQAAKVKEAVDATTNENKLALMKVGLDVREATDIIQEKFALRGPVNYIVTMPDAVVIYSVNTAAMLNPVKSTETIPYRSITSVDYDDGLMKNGFTLRTSGKTFTFETMMNAKFAVETINSRR